MSAGGVPRRLFFALWPDEATRAALHRETRALVRHSGGKPVRPAGLHLTLAFIGTVAAERVHALAAASRAVAVSPVTLALDRIGWFEAARVLWIGPSAPPAALARLASDLRQAVTAAGFQPDLKPFHPHVTLARKVAAPPESPRTRPVDWTVGGFALIESRTEPGTHRAGARYEPVANFP